MDDDERDALTLQKLDDLVKQQNENRDALNVSLANVLNMMHVCLARQTVIEQALLRHGIKPDRAVFEEEHRKAKALLGDSYNVAAWPAISNQGG